MTTRVTFVGSPRKCHWMGSEPGTTLLWLPGETRELSDDVARELLDVHAGLFESADPTPDKGKPAKAPPRAIRSAAKKSPATRKKTTRKKAGG